MNEFFRCKKCLNQSNRPRIEFNEEGLCNACQWAQEKKTTVDWKARQLELEKMLSKYRGKTSFDCIVPVSGGKDSSYVAYTMKHTHKMNPLCVTINPPLRFEIGKENLENFVNAGYDLLACSPNPEVMRAINKKGLIEYGIPMLGWQLAVQAYIPQIAVKFGIPLIMYGEDGEVEYGGSQESKNRKSYNIDYSKNIYLTGVIDSVLKEAFSNAELAMFSYPTEDDIKSNNVAMCHWSYFENWDSMHNFEVAKKYCGLKPRPKTEQSSSYTNTGQNDTCLYDLHTYLMFLKFGFGRACQDAGIDIRTGRLSREEGIEIVKKYDGIPPTQYYEKYCEYYQMSMDDFLLIIDKHANKDMLIKENSLWRVKNYIF